jgi:26S proteasome regulatory subunit N12
VKQQSSPPADAVALSDFLGLQRATLESAAFLSLYAKDVPAFVRYIAQLKTSYNDMRAYLPPSKAQAPLLGAYLLCLLAQNHIADFHTEYDLLAYAATSAPAGGNIGAASSSSLPPSSPTSSRSVSGSALLSSSCIAFPVALEQQLMEGSYAQILAANANSSALPYPLYALFLDTLAATVRTKIADCSEQAYGSLTRKDLAQLLKLPGGDKDVEAFVKTRQGWVLEGDNVVFPSRSGAGSGGIGGIIGVGGASEGGVAGIQALKTIQQTLAYATELERIV